MEYHPTFTDKIDNIIKMTIFPKSVYRFSIIPIEILADFFKKIKINWQSDLKIHIF